MTTKISGTIDVNELVGRVFSFLKRSYTSQLLVLGGGLMMSLNLPSVALYAIQTVLLKQDGVAPPGSFGWTECVGLALIIMAIGGAFYRSVTNERKSNAEERTQFKESFGQMSDVRLQDELHRLYKIGGADVRAIRAILSHPSNVNYALAQFQRCHTNVKYVGPWFALRGRFFKLRYNFGFFFLTLVVFHAISCLLLATVELHIPGLLKYGPYAAYYFLAISTFMAIGAFLVFFEIQKMGTAITLVEKARPAAS